MRFAAILTLLVLTGCHDRPKGFGPDGRKQVRVFLLLISTRQVEFYRWAELEFERRNPGLDIIFEQFPGSSLKDFEVKLKLRFSSKQAPDIFVAHQSLTAEFARLGLLVPAPPQIERMVREISLNDAVRDAAYHDGTCYGMVSDAAWTALYYNKAMFREAGLDPERPPRTWDELIEYADRLTVRRPDGSIVRAGFALRKTGFKPGTADKWYTLVLSAGGRLYDEEGTRALFNSEAGRAAVNLYKTILDRRIDAVDFQGDQQGFGQGRVAMFIREMHVIRWMQEHYPDVEFGVAQIPSRNTSTPSLSVGGGYLWVVSTDSPHPDDAWRFIEFIMEDDVYSRYAAIGGILPITRTVASRSEYRDDPYLRVFMDQAWRSIGPFPRDQQVGGIVGEYIERFCYGRIGPEEMLERAERDVNALLARNRREHASETGPYHSRSFAYGR